MPELKAVKVSVHAMRAEMILRNEKLEQSVRLGLEDATLAIRQLSDRMDYTGDVRERIASLEARMPRR